MTNNFIIAPESVLERNYDKIQKLTEYVKSNMINRPYHNYEHALDATRAYQTIGRNENLTPRDLFLGTSAMIAHDLITVPFAKDNEEQTIQKIRTVLPVFGYYPEEVHEIGKIIYATKVGFEPRTLLEQIAKDADTENLGRTDFFEKNKNLRLEFQLAEDVKWYQGTLNFMNSHKFYTESAKINRNARKNENIEEVIKLINLYSTKGI